jgi:hypothetical protein
MIDALSRLSTTLDEEITSATNRLAKINADTSQPRLILQFNSARKMRLRILRFASIEARTSEMHLCESRRRLLEKRREHTGHFIHLFTANLIPSDSAFTVVDPFFQLDTAVDRRNLLEVERLQSLVKRLEGEVSEFPLPRSVASFTKFFGRLVAKAAPLYDEELCYFPALAGEVSLARAVFGSPLGERIDKFIQRSVDGAWSQFADGVPIFCRMLVRNIDLRTETEQSIGVLLFFRLVVSRVYERVPQFHLATTDPAKISTVWNCPFGLMGLPEELVSPGAGDVAAHEFFRSTQKFAEPAEFLAGLDFLINPIDILVGFRQMMIKVHANAVREQLGREPTGKDLQLILGFDELFTLLFGSFVASEVADVGGIKEIVELLTPRHDLSPVLEYSLVCLEAVVLEINRMNARLTGE